MAISKRRPGVNKFLWGMRLDAEAYARELDKELISLNGLSTQLTGKLENTGSIMRKGKEIFLFPFVDKGTSKHVIVPEDAEDAEVGVLWNPLKEFGPVRGAVYHPGTEGYNITGRVVSFFLDQVEKKFSGPSTRALNRRIGESITLGLIRGTFQQALLQTRNFAASITPNSWVQVKRGYIAKMNNREIKDS